MEWAEVELVLLMVESDVKLIAVFVHILFHQANNITQQTHRNILHTHKNTACVCVCVSKCSRIFIPFVSFRPFNLVRFSRLLTLEHFLCSIRINANILAYLWINASFSLFISPFFAAPFVFPPPPHTFCVPSVCVSLSSRLLFMFAVVFVCGVIFLIHFSLLKLCCWTYTWSAVTVVFVVFSLCSDYILSDFRSVAFRSSCRCRSKIQEWLYRFAICHLDSISIYSIFVPVHGVGKRA